MTIHLGGGGSFPPALAVVATCSWHTFTAILIVLGS